MNNYDPGISPNWTFFPFMDSLKNAAGGWQAMGLIFVAALLIASALALAGGHVWDHGRSTQLGKAGIISAFAGAAIIGTADRRRGCGRRPRPAVTSGRGRRGG